MRGSGPLPRPGLGSLRFLLAELGRARARPERQGGRLEWSCGSLAVCAGGGRGPSLAPGARGTARAVLVSTAPRCCPGPARVLRLGVFRSQEHCRATALFCLV